MLPEPYLWERAERDITQEPEALRTGWASLNNKIAGFHRGALSVIAAPTGQGKTTLMLNLLACWSDIYPDEALYFYSYEEHTRALVLKLLMIRSGVVINKTDNYGAYKNYLKFHRPQSTRPVGMSEQQAQDIERAIQWYQGRAAAGRLILNYEMPTVEGLASTLSLLGRRGGVAAVIVDYIQRMPITGPERTGSQQRYQALAYAAQLMTGEAVRGDMAVIIGSQLNDAEQMYEARAIEHEANLVVKLKSKGEADKEQPDMSIYVQKNRSGPGGSTTYLQYERPALRLLDKGLAAGSGQWG